MKIKKIIIVRSGDYGINEPYNLTEYGIKSIKNLARQLLPYLEDQKIVCLSSLANRAVESSEILQSVWKSYGFVVPIEKKSELLAESAIEKYIKKKKNDAIANLSWLYDRITLADIEGVDIVVVVTHLELLEIQLLWIK